MGTSFSDITLYTHTPYKVGTREFIEEASLQNFVSDLYVQKMHGYKPPKTSRITIQTAYHGIWNQPRKTGSIVAVAPFFSYEEYNKLDRHGKYKYTLDLIQDAVLQLSDEYFWDKLVFEGAYKEVIECDFVFTINYPQKLSRDKKKVAHLSLEKSETITSLYVNIESNGSTSKSKLFDKENTWWYDCVYFLVRHNKWIDANTFGISFSKGKIDIWYLMEEKEVKLFENGNRVNEVDFKKYFLFG